MENIEYCFSANEVYKYSVVCTDRYDYQFQWCSYLIFHFESVKVFSNDVAGCLSSKISVTPLQMLICMCLCKSKLCQNTFVVSLSDWLGYHNICITIVSGLWKLIVLRSLVLLKPEHFKLKWRTIKMFL